MSLAVALVPSNQDRNLGAIPGYSEAGGCAIIASKVEQLLADRHTLVRVYTAPLESQDDSRHTKLAATMREARQWLDTMHEDGRGYTPVAVHIHTNAGSTPQAGTSHTGYCYGSPEGAALGKVLANRVSAVLGLPVVAYDYTGLGYLFNTLFAPLPSALIEITRHDRRADLERLYASVDAVAAAVVSGILAWAGESAAPSPPDDLATLRARNQALEAALRQCRDALAAVGF